MDINKRQRMLIILLKCEEEGFKEKLSNGMLNHYSLEHEGLRTTDIARFSGAKYLYTHMIMKEYLADNIVRYYSPKGKKLKLYVLTDKGREYAKMIYSLWTPVNKDKGELL